VIKRQRLATNVPPNFTTLLLRLTKRLLTHTKAQQAKTVEWDTARPCGTRHGHHEMPQKHHEPPRLRPLAVIDSQMIREALLKARADLAPLFKEQERDERGRFAGGGGDAGKTTEQLKAKSEALKEKVWSGKASGKEAAAQHREIAQAHSKAADNARASGDKKLARLHDKAARAHESAAGEHDTSTRRAPTDTDDARAASHGAWLEATYYRGR
jgi:hypothetical protein